MNLQSTTVGGRGSEGMQVYPSQNSPDTHAQSRAVNIDPSTPQCDHVRTYNAYILVLRGSRATETNRGSTDPNSVTREYVLSPPSTTKSKIMVRISITNRRGPQYINNPTPPVAAAYSVPENNFALRRVWLVLRAAECWPRSRLE